ncbi:9665_t:CDS:2, partial [Racocetra fulgida]
PRHVWDEEGANWIRSGPTKCALKKIEYSDKMNKEYLIDILRHYRSLQGRLTVDCLGITRDSTGCYLIVMKYYRENLYSHLKNGTKYLHWKDIVNMLHKIANGLKQIHDHKLYHGNLHGGNLMIEHTIEGIHVRISDIGLHRNSSA